MECHWDAILGPGLFSLYMLPLASIFNKHRVSFHLYADDTQIYLPIKHEKNSKLWLSSNILNLNENKTEIILLGPKENCVADLDLVCLIV